MRPLILPPPVFPLATGIRLSGCMTSELVRSILQQSVPHLRQLALVNLLQWSGLSPPLPTFTSNGHAETHFADEDLEHDCIPNTRCITGSLEPFIRKCLALTSLTIITVGINETYCLPTERDDVRYAEWARFLTSVRGTVCFFSFKQAFNRNYYHASRGGFPWRIPKPHYGSSPMDKTFSRWILPIVMEGYWPHMRRIGFKGIGPTIAKGCDVAFSGKQWAELRELLPGNAELIVEEKPENDYENPEREDDGIW
jgi:hypothetical protein